MIIDCIDLVGEERRALVRSNRMKRYLVNLSGEEIGGTRSVLFATSEYKHFFTLCLEAIRQGEFRAPKKVLWERHHINDVNIYFINSRIEKELKAPTFRIYDATYDGRIALITRNIRVGISPIVLYDSKLLELSKEILDSTVLGYSQEFCSAYER